MRQSRGWAVGPLCVYGHTMTRWSLRARLLVSFDVAAPLPLDRPPRLPETPPMAPGLGWCAWCGKVIGREHVDDHGTRYHVGCWATRVALVSPEPPSPPN